MQRKDCPVCASLVESNWSWLYACKPFWIRCQQCRSRLHVQTNFLLSFVFDSIAPVAGVLVVIVAVGMSKSTGPWLVPWGIFAAIVLAFIVEAIPGVLGQYAIVRKWNGRLLHCIASQQLSVTSAESSEEDSSSDD